MTTNYKALKEAFVSNLSGGSVWEVYVVTGVMTSSVLLWSILQSRMSYFTPYTPAACITDLILHCGVVLLALTLYSSHPLLLHALLLAPAIAIYATHPNPRRPTTSKTVARSRRVEPKYPVTSTDSGTGVIDLPIKPFVTMYRGAMMSITCAAILAVDFRIFPRRFAKAETWGTSIMDMGVGSFVFTAGTVSARAILKERQLGKRVPLLKRLYVSVRHSLPLLVLGLARLWSVKELDYAEHVSEYGVHWNFFFTLAFLPPFVAMFDSAARFVPSYAVLAFVLAAVYQIALDSTNLKKFLLSAPRNDLLSMNREGIFSFFGYLAIFLTGRSAGTHILPRERSVRDFPDDKPGSFISKAMRYRQTALGTLVSWSIIWSVLYLITTEYYSLNLSVSRRLANLPYVLWVASYNCTQLAFCYLAEKLSFPWIYGSSDEDKAKEKKRIQRSTSQVLNAINRNGLAVFLFANLLTGLINMTLPTLHMTELQSIGVLLAYMAVLGTSALILDFYDISIKL
ncbi:GPI-anchored wall transfer protein-like protein 1 [Eremomyces bilateralis CBS 781.70]|uniref:GPI-anchored wall transfer protein n=1 Tax=Eremomyces bilateralis CBS 781.70 TaxID=1392243 RepID=A0A6G1FT45_9PEZI|nr:GPI-anchored wall transfer protein-like protein 1 [Eremomyces bilateralis CBS 781.70]KAF1808906.1 GPI-anchored wall transfer protein-like protein 1 [Eremomyces bilateralis CBS 781.70]